MESLTKRIFAYENVLTALLFFVFGLVFIERLALPFLWHDIAAELNLKNTQLGDLSAALALAWAFSGAALGYLADKYHSRRLMLICAIIVFSVSSALSGAVTSFIALLFFRILMGIAEGPVLPISQSYLAEASRPARRGLNMGLVTNSAPGLMGGILGPPVMLWTANLFGWRYAFYLTIIPGFLISVVIYLIIKTHNEHQKHNYLQVEKAKENEPKQKRIPYLQLLKMRNVVLCLLISCFFVTWFLAILNFGPTFLLEVSNLSEANMALVMSAIGFAWVFWGAIIPALSDKVGRKPVMIIFSFIAVLCPIVLLTVRAPILLSLLVFLTFTGLGCFSLFMATIPSETVPITVVATTLGLIMGIGEVMGGGIGPLVFGRLADIYGLQIVMWIASCCAAIACILSLFLKETAPIKRQKQVPEPSAVKAMA